MAEKISDKGFYNSGRQDTFIPEDIEKTEEDYNINIEENKEEKEEENKIGLPEYELDINKFYTLVNKKFDISNDDWNYIYDKLKEDGKDYYFRFAKLNNLSKQEMAYPITDVKMNYELDKNEHRKLVAGYTEKDPFGNLKTMSTEKARKEGFAYTTAEKNIKKFENLLYGASATITGLATAVAELGSFAVMDLPATLLESASDLVGLEGLSERFQEMKQTTDRITDPVEYSAKAWGKKFANSAISQQYPSYNKLDAKGKVEKFVAQLHEQIPIIASITASSSMGHPEAALPLIGAYIGGQRIATGLYQGESTNEAISHGIVNGTIAGLTERIGGEYFVFGKFADDLAKMSKGTIKKGLTSYFKNLGRYVPQAIIGETSEEVIENYAVRLKNIAVGKEDDFTGMNIEDTLTFSAIYSGLLGVSSGVKITRSLRKGYLQQELAKTTKNIQPKIDELRKLQLQLENQYEREDYYNKKQELNNLQENVEELEGDEYLETLNRIDTLEKELAEIRNKESFQDVKGQIRQKTNEIMNVITDSYKQIKGNLSKKYQNLSDINVNDYYNNQGVDLSNIDNIPQQVEAILNEGNLKQLSDLYVREFTDTEKQAIAEYNGVKSETIGELINNKIEQQYKLLTDKELTEDRANNLIQYYNDKQLVDTFMNTGQIQGDISLEELTETVQRVSKIETENTSALFKAKTVEQQLNDNIKILQQIQKKILETDINNINSDTAFDLANSYNNMRSILGLDKIKDLSKRILKGKQKTIEGYFKRDLTRVKKYSAENLIKQMTSKLSDTIKNITNAEVDENKALRDYDKILRKITNGIDKGKLNTKELLQDLKDLLPIDKESPLNQITKLNNKPIESYTVGDIDLLNKFTEAVITFNNQRAMELTTLSKLETKQKVIQAEKIDKWRQTREQIFPKSYKFLKGLHKVWDAVGIFGSNSKVKTIVELVQGQSKGGLADVIDALLVAESAAENQKEKIFSDIEGWALQKYEETGVQKYRDMAQILQGQKIDKSSLNLLDSKGKLIVDDIKLTQLYTLYIMINNAKSINRIFKGGIRAEQLGKGFAKLIHQVEGKDINEIAADYKTLLESQLDEHDMEIIGKINQTYDRIYNIVNEVFERMNGYRLNKEEFYVKLLTHEQDVKKLKNERVEKTAKGGISYKQVSSLGKYLQKDVLNNPSSQKGRTLNETPVLLKEINDTLNHSLKEATWFANLSEPVKDLRAFLANLEESPVNTEEGKLLNRYRSDYGIDVYDYLNELASDLERGKAPINPVAQKIKNILSKLTRAVLVAKIPIAVLQRTSILYAMTDNIEKRYFIPAFLKLPKVELSRSNEREMMQYSTVLGRRIRTGKINRETALLAENTPGRGWVESLMNTPIVGLAWHDRKTIGYIWEAAKSKVRAEQNFKVEGKEFFKEVDRIATENVQNTQPMFDLALRSEVARKRGDPVSLSLTMFQSATNQFLNHNVRLIQRYVNSNHTASDKASLTTNLLITTIFFQMLSYAVRNTDDIVEGRKTADEVFSPEAIISGVVAQNFAGMPIASDMIESASNIIAGQQFYDMTNPAYRVATEPLDAFSNLYRALETTDEDTRNEASKRALIKGINSVGFLTGTPGSATTNLIKSIENISEQ